MGYYESTLERDMMELIRFDRRITRFTAQPLIIYYTAEDGKTCTYTPDGFMSFRDEDANGAPILYEIKYREDFKKDWRVLIKKFRAAKQYCAERGWNFRVYTEKEIRTPFLTNVKFLWPFINRSIDPAISDALFLAAQRLKVVTPKDLLRDASVAAIGSGLVTPVLWHLIASGQIECDLHEKLTLNSKLLMQQECDT